ncbi:hypothetical protein L7F22_003749 [Adiantum nelumboides]|nr:hypothetical protein [Adiantum nelumboides]
MADSNEEPSIQPRRIDSVGARGTCGQNVMFSGSTSLISASLISPQVKGQVEQMLDTKRDALKVVNTTLDTVRVELQGRNQDMWKIQGTSSAALQAAVLQGQLQELQILKDNMEGAIDVTHPDYLVIEGKVAALKSTVTALGVDASSSNIRDEVDRLKLSLSPFLANLKLCGSSSKGSKGILIDLIRIVLDDLNVFGAQQEYLHHLRLCFLKCREVNFSLNPLKCAFAIRNGRLLVHVILKDGIFVDPHKIAAIMEAPAPTNAKQCAIFLGQARWHGRSKCMGSSGQPYYASRRLSSAKKNYSVTKRECLGMIYSVKKFRHYLLGRRFFFHVDHSALLYLVYQQNLTGRLARWVLLLQEFEFEVIHRPGAQHAVVNYLSRLDSGGPPIGIADEFLDTLLFLTGVVVDEARLEQSTWRNPSIPWTWYE